MASKKDLNKAELETVRISKNPTMVVIANGEVQTREEATVYVRELDLFVTVMLLENTPAVLSLGKTLRQNSGPVTIGPVARNHISSKMARKFIATHQIIYHSSYLVYPWVPLPHQLRLHLHRSETVTDTEIPAIRSEKASEDSSAWGNSWQESARVENPNKNDDEELQSGELQGVPDRLQEFTHALVDESVPEHRDASSSSHDKPLEPRAKVVPTKHNNFTSVPERPELRYLLEDENNEGFLQKTHRYSRAQSRKIGDLITADHKVLGEGCESRHNHRYAVMVQDLTTQWIQSYSCKTKHFSGNGQKSLQKFLEATRKPKVILQWQFFGIWQSLWRINLESLYVNAAQIGNEWDRWESGAQN